MSTVQITVAPAVERRVNPQISVVDPMQKQDDDFMKVWLNLRNQTMMLGPGRPLICDETLAVTRCFDYE